MTIPKVLLKRLYTEGSLKNTDAGAQFALKNRLSDVIEIAFETRPFGTVKFKVQDAIGGEHDRGPRIPRSERDDYAPGIVRERQAFVEETSGVKLRHLVQYSFDPHLAKGNCGNFTGAAQVPVSFAGPLRIDGEHAQGDFLIPLATSEGTLVASYNRGVKALNACGGVKVTVMDDAMQRAPVVVFQDARAGRDFAHWVEGSLEPIRREAEATSSVARLLLIEPYLANKFVYLGFK